PRDAVEEIEAVVLPQRQGSRIAHRAVGISKIDCRVPRLAWIVSHTLKPGNQSKVHSPVLTLLTAGHTKISGSKFIDQIRHQYVRVAESEIAAMSHEQVAESRHERYGK